MLTLTVKSVIRRRARQDVRHLGDADRVRRGAVVGRVAGGGHEPHRAAGDGVVHLGRREGPEVERRGGLVVDQRAGDGLGLVDRRDDRVAVAEVVGLDHDRVGVVAELGEVGQVARGRDGNGIDVREAVERIGIVRDGQHDLAVV